jgi:hypothetical protein
MLCTAEVCKKRNRLLFEHLFHFRKTDVVFPQQVATSLLIEGEPKMKKIARLFVAAILLTFAMSTASLADGGSPLCQSRTCQ